MSAPLKNEYWKLRDKDGRDRLFADPNELMSAAVEYFTWSKENPWIKIDFKGSDLKQVELPTERPLTIKGLCVHLGVNFGYFSDFKASLKDKTDEVSKDFSEVINYIEQIIYVQKFEGAAVGVFNANIISADIGLIKKSSHDVNFDTMSDTQLTEIIDKLIEKSHEP